MKHPKEGPPNKETKRSLNECGGGSEGDVSKGRLVFFRDPLTDCGRSVECL